MVADELAERWGLSRPKAHFRGLVAEGRAPAGSEFGVSGVSAGLSSGGMSAKTDALRPPTRARVAVLWPQTYMNDAGRSVGPARGSFKLPLERVLVVHDEIDLPFGEVRTRLGGGLAGHNGLKSLKRELGSADFMRVRVGVGRPVSTDPEIVSAYVLGRFREAPTEVGELIDRACEAVERVVLDESPSPPGSP
jgi:peptidyl-tRNA hydrolase, PTH1 family